MGNRRLAKHQRCRKYCIINADDFGLAPKTNLAIKKAYTHGMLTSTSLLVTCPGYLHAVRLARSVPGLGIGVHVSLTLGIPVSPHASVTLLTRSDRSFIPSFRYYLMRKDPAFLCQIESEISAQIETCIKAGIRPHHIDSQSHIHMIPHIFEILYRLARRYRISYIRLSKDRIYATADFMDTVRPFINTNIVKLLLLNTLSVFNGKIIRTQDASVNTVDEYYGVCHTGRMSTIVMQAIADTIKPGITEVNIHPGYGVNDTDFDFHSQYMHDFMVSPDRVAELETLRNPGLARYMRKRGIILTNFKKLSI